MIKNGDKVWKQFYGVDIEKISIGNKGLKFTDFKKIKNFNTFFDTGTTFTLFESELYDNIEKSIHHYCYSHKDRCDYFVKAEKDNCFSLPDYIEIDFNKLYQTYPPINFIFKPGVKYSWKPQDYFTYEKEPNVLCFMF